MVEFDRNMLKNDPVMNQLFEIVKKNHKVAEHTKRVLLKNKHIKDFCEEARHYSEMPGKKPIYLHYDVASWFKEPMGVQIKIESIGIYDDFMEYNTARMRGLHSGRSADIPNIN